MPPTISNNCEDGYHDACDGLAPRLEWNEHDRPCKCVCHSPEEE
jgi:hypothetical protein